jgi:hypothetical protein
MRKRFGLASLLAVFLLIFSGSGALSTYSTPAATASPCVTACADQMTLCIQSGAPVGYCFGQYHKCENKCD